MKNDSKVETMNFCNLLLIYFLLITLGSNVVPTTTIQNLEVEESTFKNNDTDETDFELSIINVDIPSLQTATNKSVMVVTNDKTSGIGTSNTVDLDTGDVIVDNGGEHGAATVTSGNQSLTAGILYPIAIIAGNNTGPGSLTFSVSRNGGTSYFTDLSDLVFYDPAADNGFNLT